MPKTSFLDRVEPLPQDLENYVIKPLFSFAGLGVILNPTKEDLANIPKEKRSQYILQERMHFEPVIETPLGGTKAEIRIMYIWLDELLPVMTISPHGTRTNDGRRPQQKHAMGRIVGRVLYRVMTREQVLGLL